MQSILQKDTFYRFSLSSTSSLQRTLGNRISEKQLQQNLSTDQQQLQDSNLAQTNFQQLSLEQHTYKEKILNNELATTFENKKSLEEELSFQIFFVDNLVFPDDLPSFRRVSREELLQEAACKQQLYPDRRRSLQRTASSSWLSSSQCEQAAFQQQLVSAECGQSSFTPRPFTSLL